MKDVAYGTRQIRVGKDLSEEIGGVVALNEQKPGKRRDSFSFVGAPTSDMLDHHLIANLERGQNIFEIHLTRVFFLTTSIRLKN